MPQFGRDAAQDAQIDNLLSRVQNLEINPISLAELGGEPVGAEVRAKIYADSLIPALIARLDKLEGDYPNSHIHFWGLGTNAYNGTISKTIISESNSGRQFGRLAYIEPPAIGDVGEFEFSIKSGSYLIEILHNKANYNGNISFYIDDLLLGSVDAYASTSSLLKTSYTVNFSQSGKHKFKALVTGKNASSSNYYFTATSISIIPAPYIPPVNLVLINAGDLSSYTATDGRIWSADQYYSGGVRTDLEAALGAFTVQGTQNQRLYKFERALDNGAFTYSIPIGQPGTFTVKLLFAENYHSSTGQRVGSVAINGSNYLSNFDIFAEAGGKNIALIKAWNNVVMPSSTVTIEVTNTLINGIELVRSS